MKIGRPPLLPKPYVIAESYLFSSNVAETEYSAYSSTGTYIIGDVRQVVTPSSTVTISNGNPALVTWANHMLPNNTPVAFTTSGSLPAGLTAGQVYFVRDSKHGSFRLSSSPGGAPIATSSAGSGTHTATATRHDVYEALLPTANFTASLSGTTLTVTAVANGPLVNSMVIAGSGITAGTAIVRQLTGTTGSTGTYEVSISHGSVASNSRTGNGPVTDTTYWARVGSTTRWRMFDSSHSSQTVNPDSIVVELRPVGRFSAMFLGNMMTDTIQVVYRDSTGATIEYDETFSGDANNWENFYGWYFDPPEKRLDLLISDLPMTLNPRITVTLTNTGGTAACGACVPCIEREIGATQYGMAMGIKDFSSTATDAYNNRDLEEGEYSKTCRVTVMVPNTDVDAVMNILSSYRGTAVVYSGSDDFASSVVFGWLSDFHEEVTFQTHSLLSAEMESL